ncbi:MAG: HK97 family phage prohead protease [Alphaproteobacteria bacterium]
MLHGAAAGRLELRRADDGGAVLTGRFPYRTTAVLGRVGGRERRERFAPGALQPAAEVHLLAQHDFARPLASTGAGTLTVRNTARALTFEARIAPAVAQTTHGADALALIAAGEARGLSPGFAVPAGGDEVRAEGDALVRTVKRAELVELSVVTRPAFGEAQVEARNWRPTAAATPRPASWRWR